jgi:predicted amidohydrolase
VADGDWHTNLAGTVAAIGDAPDADLYLLPELWTSGYAHDRWPEIARESVAPAHDALRAIAGTRNAAVAGSMISLNDDGALVNRFWHVTATGTSWYDKVHLFPPLREPELLVAGDRRQQVQVGPLRCGLSVCFDLRFPAMYRRDALEGAHAFVVCSEWPRARADALRTLCRARAIENQAYLILCNRTGVAADGLVFGGGSVVLSPLGEVLAELDEEPGSAVATVEADVVDTLRREFPVLPSERAGVD